MGELSNIIGTAIQTIAILGTVGGFIFRLHLDLKLLIQQQTQSVQRISKIETRMEQLSQVVVEIARQDARLNNLEARIQELSNRLFVLLDRSTEHKVT